MISKIDPLGDNKSLVEYIQHMGTDRMVVNAARVSFAQDNRNSEIFYESNFDSQNDIDQQDQRLINYLARNQHSSPFQHCLVTLHISCPLFVYAQWRRHRTFNYTQINEVSRRYTSEDLQFYIPKKGEIRGQSNNNKQASEGLVDEQAEAWAWIREAVGSAELAYKMLIEEGVAREIARMVLPQNMYTRFYATVDLWNLYHFWSLRKDPHAQYEIQVYAEAIDSILSKLYPVSWSALKGDK